VRISLLIDNLGSGGAQRQIVLLAIELDKLGHHVDLVIYGLNKHMAYMLDETNVNLIVAIENEGVAKIRRSINIVLLIRSIRPDVLISYLDTPNKLSCIYKFFHPKVLWIPSERNLNSGSGWQVHWRKVIYFMAKVVVCNSHAQSCWLLSQSILNKDKVIVIWNGVYQRFFDVFKERDRLFEGSKRFISLGRLSYQKNPELLIKAIELLSEEWLMGCEFEWFGEEDPTAIGKRDELTRRTMHKKLPLIFYESLSNPENKLRDIGCLILTSRYEGTPNVVLEAMAAGVFIIAPDIVDLPVILGNDERGLVFKSENPEALAKGIKKYLKMDVVARNKIISFARTYALKEFTGVNMAKHYSEVFTR